MENHAGLDLSFGGSLDPRQSGKTASAFYDEGEWHLRQGDPALAVEAFNAALEIDSGDVRSHVGQVWASWSNGVVRSEACRRRLQSLLKRSGGDLAVQAMIHGLLGRLEVAMNNKTKGAEHYKLAQELDPAWESYLPEPSAPEASADERGQSMGQGGGSWFRRLVARLQL